MIQFYRSNLHHKSTIDKVHLHHASWIDREEAAVLLENKNAVIYGGGGAVGGAVARAFGREGATVHLAGRTRASLDLVAKEIAAAGGRAETAEVDAQDASAVLFEAVGAGEALQLGEFGLDAGLFDDEGVAGGEGFDLGVGQGRRRRRRRGPGPRRRPA
jgi:hypothetical protein